jgi:hypothetical protein
MNTDILITDFTNPTLLFFLLGILASVLKSDLEIPENSFKFISLYLLFSIGFKGGQELQHGNFGWQMIGALLLGVFVSALIPVYTFFILKKKLSVSDAGAIAASYGSVSAVTFVAAVSFLEIQNLTYDGHMVAVMAFMEFPAIIVGVLLMRRFEQDQEKGSMKKLIHHAFSNGSVLLLMGSLFIGMIADSKQAEDIKPFTTDIFKGFLALFLLEMGITTAKRFSGFMKYGSFLLVFAILIPLINGCAVAFISKFILHDIGNQFIMSILGASASYIAVPAAMRLAAPKADPGIYIPMALGVTFPINITLGMPLYFWILTI